MSTFRTVWIFPTLALSIIASGIAHADVIVTANVTPNGGLFQYDYSIANQTANDLSVLDIAVTPDITIGDLTAPTGFETAYDSRAWAGVVPGEYSVIRLDTFVRFHVRQLSCSEGHYIYRNARGPDDLCIEHDVRKHRGPRRARTYHADARAR